MSDDGDDDDDDDDEDDEEEVGAVYHHSKCEQKLWRASFVEGIEARRDRGFLKKGNQASWLLSCYYSISSNC